MFLAFALVLQVCCRSNDTCCLLEKLTLVLFAAAMRALANDGEGAPALSDGGPRLDPERALDGMTYAMIEVANPDEPERCRVVRALVDTRAEVPPESVGPIAKAPPLSVGTVWGGRGAAPGDIPPPVQDPSRAPLQAPFGSRTPRFLGAVQCGAV